MATEWMDNLLNGGKIEKEAMESQGTDKQDHFERKVIAHPWVNEVLDLDPVKVEAEFLAAQAAEAKLLGKTAAQEANTPEEVIESDYVRQVKAYSDFNLVELLALARAHKDNVTAEQFATYKEKAKANVESGRVKCEEELLKLTGDHTLLDWADAFKKFSKDATPEQPAEKKLYTPEVPEKKVSFDSPSENKFKLPTKEEMVPAGNGREADERQEVTKEASLEKKAEIFRQNVPTKGGNTLSFFYNPENNLLVVDLIAANEEGGNELVRQTIDESSMLEHTASNKTADKVKDNPADDKGNLAMPEGKKSAGDKPVESVEESTLLSSPKEVGDKSDQAAEANSPEKGDKAKLDEAVNKEASIEKKAEVTPSGLKNKLVEMGYSEESANAISGQWQAGQTVGTEPKTKLDVDRAIAELSKTAEPVSPLTREELPTVEVKAEGEVCPVCGGPGRDLGNLGQLDHFRCEDCGITFSHKRGSCTACAPACSSLNEIKSQASKTEVIAKIAELNKKSEVASPWIITKDAEGNDVIARIEQPKNEKVSEEEKEDELKK